MAPRTFGTEFSAMNVVSAVTSDTSARLMHAITGALRVACLALKADMCACQRKMGLMVVVE